MAKYHCDLADPINTGSDHCGSAVAHAAYITGESLKDLQYGGPPKKFERDDVAASSNFGWAGTTEQLWNEATAVDCKLNGQQKKSAVTARKLTVALPYGMSLEDQIKIAEDIVGELRWRYGCAGTWAIHKPSMSNKKENLLRPDSIKNDHLHVAFTARGIDDDGNWAKVKYRDFAKDRSRTELEGLRKFVAKTINFQLQESGFKERVDHRSWRAKALAGDAPWGIEPMLKFGTAVAGMFKRLTKAGGKIPAFLRREQAKLKRNQLRWDIFNLERQIALAGVSQDLAQSANDDVIDVAVSGMLGVAKTTELVRKPADPVTASKPKPPDEFDQVVDLKPTIEPKKKAKRKGAPLGNAGPPKSADPMADAIKAAKSRKSENERKPRKRRRRNRTSR